MNTETLEKHGCFDVVVWGTVHRSLLQRREANTCHSGMASTVGSSAGHWYPARGWNSSKKVGGRAEIRRECADFHYFASFGASSQGRRAEQQIGKLSMLFLQI